MFEELKLNSGLSPQPTSETYSMSPSLPFRILLLIIFNVERIPVNRVCRNNASIFEFSSYLIEASFVLSVEQFVKAVRSWFENRKVEHSTSIMSPLFVFVKSAVFPGL